jgi:hypothetical protein
MLPKKAAIVAVGILALCVVRFLCVHSVFSEPAPSPEQSTGGAKDGVTRRIVCHYQTRYAW